MAERYEKRGVSADKQDVHKAVAHIGKGLYPGAFCRIYPDILGGDETFVNASSADGCGTKSILAYLYWRETGDASVWKGIAQDALVMNTDDLICAGAQGPFLFTSIINRNKNRIPGEVLAMLIEGAAEFCELMHRHGTEIIYAGGETADLGDLVRTITVDAALSVRFPKKNVIDASRIKPGLSIVALASDGQTSYESSYNSGISSNGLTSARHDLLHTSYASLYPETFDPETDPSVVYSGPFRLTDPLPGSPLNIGQALLSPTRTFLPLLARILPEFGPHIAGIINCTGGAQSKVLHYVKGVRIIKDRLLPVPPLFRLIKETSGASWTEMFKVLNCGTRMEIYVPDEYADHIIAMADAMNIKAGRCGYTEHSQQAEVEIRHEGEIIRYLPNP